MDFLSQLASGTIVKLASTAAARFISSTASWFKGDRKQLSIEIQSLVGSTFEHVRSIRTIINKAHSFDISEIFVEPQLDSGSQPFDCDELVRQLFSKEDYTKRIVLWGNAGSGKSMILRYLLVENTRGWWRGHTTIL